MKVFPRYLTLSDFTRINRLVLPKPRVWWLLSVHETGHIHALQDRTRGVAIATNGPLIAIETETKGILIGHRDWWVKESDSVTMQPPKGYKGVKQELKNFYIENYA
jgi:hypothetical protein